MISLEKLKILEPTQKLPKTVGEIAKSGHTAGFTWKVRVRSLL